MERITATFDKETAAAIRRLAGKGGVSSFLQEAARERLARLELLALLDELDAKHGAPTAEVVAEVDAEAERVFGAAPRRKRRVVSAGKRRRRAAA